MSELERLIHEIHRRSLWQVLGIYLAGSWVALQVVETLSESMTLPEWVQPLALVLLVIGLPVVLATAFVQEGVGRSPETSARAPEPVGTSPLVEPSGPGTPGEAPQGEPTAASSTSQGRGLFTWRRAILGGVGAFALLVVALGGWMALRSLGIGPAGTLVAKGVLERQATLLLTDFEADDPSLARAATEALRVDLDQSSVIDLANTGFVSAALRRMERDPDEPLDLATGRELGVREGMPAVIAGEITAAGTGYVLTTRVLTPDEGDVLVSERETAADDSELVAAIDRLSKKLRERIGESLRDLAGGPPLERVTTGDLEALRLYSQAVRASDRGESQRAADLLEETVARDSSFAMAWRKLGMIHVSGGGSLGRLSRGVEALDRAYALRDRLTERERHLATAGYFSFVQRDDRRAAAAYEQLIELNPRDNWALNNLAIIVGNDFGEYERAIGLLRRAMVQDSLSSTHHFNLSIAETNLGDFDAAATTLAAWRRRLPGDATAPAFQASLAAAQLDFETADEYARETATIRPGNLFDRYFSHLLLAGNAAARGRLESALSHMREAERANVERDAPGEALAAAVWGAWLHQALGNDRETASALLEEALARYPLDEMGPLDPPWDFLSVAHAQIHGADGGDAMVRRWAEVDPNAHHEEDHGLAQGWVALARGDEAEAIRHFREAVQPDCQPCAMPGIAAAFEAAGQPDSAIAYYEQYLARPYLFRILTDARHLGPGVERLGQLYDERGDLESAAKYYAMFTELWAEADPELQPRVRAAQARLEQILRERG